ncbi:MAG: LysE family transporter [Thermodesulfobacteriota bacterium]
MEYDIFGYLGAGAALGLGAGLSPGPLLALVLKQSFSHGTKEGVKVAFSPLLTDLPVLVLAIMGVAWIKTHPVFMGGISIAGAAVVAFLGYECFRVRPLALPDMRVAPASIKKGVLTNFANPHVYIFWFTVGGPTTVLAAESGLLSPAAFLGGFYACIVGSKTALAVLAGRSRNFLSGRGYLILMRFLGAALFLFALFLIRDGLEFMGIL